MLPAINRLNKGLFSNIYRRGRRVSAKFVSLIILSGTWESARFGFVVSKKNAPKAFQRNRIKRIMREAVRQKMKDVKEGNHIIIKFIARAEPNNLSEERKRINGEIELLFSRARLIKK